MFSSILEKVLAVMLTLVIVAAMGTLWYADHEHEQIAPLKLSLASAALSAKQAGIDRDQAIKAASDAVAQLKIANDAKAQAVQSAEVAATAASSAHANLVKAAQSKAVAATLDAPLEPQVWGAIFNSGD